MNEEREAQPQWRCFAVLSPTVSLLVMETIQNHQDCECYICDIFENEDEPEQTTISNL